ncbi:MAG: hypothetical protein GY749_06685 [Desulfobacteraceae bacterium]|nr:hypothetical protein [Desulfobacteraceae bacterium]MCP4352049.1 hypothetical protein [Desulfobacterales bacterium]
MSKKFLKIGLVFILVLTFASTGALGLDEVKIVSDYGEPYGRFGTSVSVSGNDVIVGSPGHYNTMDGGVAVSIFSYNGVAWEENYINVDRNNKSNFGISVSISDDYAIVGDSGDDDNGTDSGSVYFLRKHYGSWSPQYKMTVSNSNAYEYYFGCSVSIDGEYAIVGAYGDDSAYIFHRNGLTWEQQAKLTASGGEDFFGYSVSISGDYAIVGASYHPESVSDENGSAYIFHRNGSVWEEQTILNGYGPGIQGDLFGLSVSVSGDYAIVGAYGDFSNTSFYGSAYIFHRNGSSWESQAKLTAGDGDTGSIFGSSVSISGDYAIVGALIDNNTPSGSAFVFHRNGTAWENQDKLTASDGQGVDKFGLSVSISSDYAIAGAMWDDNWNGFNAGSAYIYNLSPQPVQISDPAPGSTLSSTTQTFTWNDTGASTCWMWIGTSPESYDIYSGDQGTNTSVTVSGLPFSGETLYVRLFSMVNSEWFTNDYTYTAPTVTAAGMQSPAPGSVLTSTTETFTWNDTGASKYWLWIGTSPESYDIYSDDQETNTSVTVSELPFSGETLYVRLLSKVNSEWLTNDYTYTAPTVTAAGMQSPAPGSVLTSTTETFTWNDTGAPQYWMWIGTSPGSYDIYSGGQETNTSVTVSELPFSGETLYVRLFSMVNSGWLTNDYTYTAAGP